VDGRRYLVVTADDYGIGPATSQGILELAVAGRVTGSVLLVTSPYAAEAVQAWRRAGQPLELGWHPCLTLDRPVAPAERVPSLVDADGCFRPLGAFLRRLWLGRVRAADLEIELQAQYERFCDLLGRPPGLVNSHHHVQVFRPIGEILRRILGRQRPQPYLRRVREPWQTLARVPGARRKRILLSLFGRRDARAREHTAFPGNDWLAGVTDPPCVGDPRFLVRWLRRMPGRVVELTCHPGYLDRTLVGRDCPPGDIHQLYRRRYELSLLKRPSFPETCRRAGFRLISASELIKLSNRSSAHAA
jgi:predicted glycoside hydrolase/deacetylase ChbG (UPF0249 family)